MASGSCRSCALPMAAEETRCIRCQLDPLPLDWCAAWGHYRGGLERVIHSFKFRRHDFFAEPLARLLDEALRDRDFDGIVPVPMASRRRRKRGYNQAELLARALAERTGIACEPLLVQRSARKTQSQLPREERVANVRHAFEARGAIAGRSLLIVDDVCTTGETLRACARALRASGAARICAVAVAKSS